MPSPVTFTRAALRASLAALVLALVLCGWVSGAGANMAKWWHDGAGHGPLVPQSDTDVRVDSEDLTFAIAPSLDRADVTATYRMTNGGAAASSAEVAFVVVAAEGAQRTAAEPQASITVDGIPVAFRVVTDADVLGPALDAWLVAHPDVEPELARLSAPTMNARYSDYAELRRHIPSCTGECDELPRWYRITKRPTKYDDDASRRAAIVAAAGVVIPDDVAKLQRGWSNLAQRRALSWLAFPLELPAGASRTVIVRYTHVAGDDTRRAVNRTFTYEYLLSPAKRWASFGALHLTIQVPPGAQLRSSLPVTRDGDTYRADFTGVPDYELSLEVMSLKGVVLGMTHPTGYWLLLLAVMLSVTAPLSVRLGRAWARGGASRLGIALRCIFGTGLLVSLANGLVMVLATALFPRGAFGGGYGPGLGLIALLFLIALGAMVVSAVSVVRYQKTRAPLAP